VYRNLLDTGTSKEVVTVLMPVVVVAAVGTTVSVPTTPTMTNLTSVHGSTPYPLLPLLIDHPEWTKITHMEHGVEPILLKSRFSGYFRIFVFPSSGGTTPLPKKSN